MGPLKAFLSPPTAIICRGQPLTCVLFRFCSLRRSASYRIVHVELVFESGNQHKLLFLLRKSEDDVI